MTNEEQIEHLRGLLRMAEAERDEAREDFRAVADAVGAMHEPSMGASHPGTRAEVVDVARRTREGRDRMLAEARAARTVPEEVRRFAHLCVSLRDCEGSDEAPLQIRTVDWLASLDAEPQPFGHISKADECQLDSTIADVCGKRCDHGSECMELRGHEPSRVHATQHGCIFYDAEPQQTPATVPHGEDCSPRHRVPPSGGDSGGLRAGDDRFAEGFEAAKAAVIALLLGDEHWIDVGGFIEDDFAIDKIRSLKPPGAQ